MWLNCIQQRSTLTKSHSNSASPRFLNAKRIYQVLILKTGSTSSLTRTWLSCSSSFLCRSKLVLYILRTLSVFIKFISMTTLVICMFQNFDKIEMLTNSESTAIKYIVNCKSKVFTCKNSTPWWRWTSSSAQNMMRWATSCTRSTASKPLQFLSISAWGRELLIIIWM